MADPKVRFKRSSVPGKIPNETQVPLGEIALNTYDGKVFASKNVGIGTTVFVVNPWSVGAGTDVYDTYFTVGNVGIGSTLPTSKLTVDGSGNFTGIVTASGGFNLGISSAGSIITSGPIKTLNFIGAGSTFAVSGTTIDISVGGGSASVAISTVAPASPTAGDLWFNSVLGRIFIYYNDGSSSQWVDASPFNEPYITEATYAISSGIATYASTAGIATYAISSGIATYASTASTAGSATYSSISGMSTYASTAGISTVSQGLTGTPDIVVGIVTATGGFNLGISSAGTTITSGPITALNFVGTGNTFAVNGTTVDISISGNSGAGAGGTWGTYSAGIATNKSVGINTSSLDDPDLTGIGNSFQGLYISNGLIIMDNVLSGNHYIGTNFNGMMAGPVTITGTLTVDGNYVVV